MMRRIQSIFVCMVVISVVSIAGCSKDEGDSSTGTDNSSTGDLVGRVYTGNWDGIPNARVCVVTYECTYTDDRAWYSISDIPVDGSEKSYMITATAPGYKPYSGSARIHANNENQHSIQLEPE